MAERDPRTACQIVRDYYSDHILWWQRAREAMQREQDFIDGDRFEFNTGIGYDERDIRSIQIRGQELQDTVRSIAAELTGRPRNIQARPVDRQDDPEAAEIAASLIDMELDNPWKGFQAQYEATILSALERRLGVLWMDWEPEGGSFGEILYSFQDPRRILWDESYDPHHPLCNTLIREYDLPVDKARELFKAPWLEPDGKTGPVRDMRRSTQPLVRAAHGGPLLPDPDRKDSVMLWQCWYKNDRTIKRKERPGTYQEWPAEKRYLRCPGCGYRSQTEGRLRAQGKLEGALPDEMLGCPVCAEKGMLGMLERIDGALEEQDVRGYARGKRLLIFAPLQQNPEGDEPLYNGNWPIPQARSFPGLFLTAFTKPGRPMGPSVTTQMWDQQIASDQLRSQGVRRALEHRNFWVIPRVGLTDLAGQPYQFRDDQLNIIQRDEMQQNQVQNINNTGLDPMWPTVFQVIQQALTQYRGVTDLGLTPESSKDIAGVTLAQLNRMGKIQIEHMRRRFDAELSKTCGVLWDYLRATYTPERIARLSMDGTDRLMRLHGDELPNFDFVIEASPEFSGLEKSRSEAATWATRALADPSAAPYFDILADLNQLPKSVIRRFEKRSQEIQQEQQQQQQQQLALGGTPAIEGPGIEPAGAAGPPPIPNGNPAEAEALAP